MPESMEGMDPIVKKVPDLVDVGNYIAIAEAMSTGEVVVKHKSKVGEEMPMTSGITNKVHLNSIALSLEMIRVAGEKSSLSSLASGVLEDVVAIHHHM